MKKILLSILLMGGLSVIAQVNFDPDFCSKVKAGYYAHADVCNAVYICNTDNAAYTHLVFCHTGLVWDQQTLQCDLPQNVEPPCGTKGQ